MCVWKLFQHCTISLRSVRLNLLSSVSLAYLIQVWTSIIDGYQSPVGASCQHRAILRTKSDILCHTTLTRGFTPFIGVKPAVGVTWLAALFEKGKETKTHRPVIKLTGQSCFKTIGLGSVKPFSTKSIIHGNDCFYSTQYFQQPTFVHPRHQNNGKSHTLEESLQLALVDKERYLTSPTLWPVNSTHLTSHQKNDGIFCRMFKNRNAKQKTKKKHQIPPKPPASFGGIS